MRPNPLAVLLCAMLLGAPAQATAETIRDKPPGAAEAQRSPAFRGAVAAWEAYLAALARAKSSQDLVTRRTTGVRRAWAAIRMTQAGLDERFARLRAVALARPRLVAQLIDDDRVSLVYEGEVTSAWAHAQGLKGAARAAVSMLKERDGWKVDYVMLGNAALEEPLRDAP